MTASAPIQRQPALKRATEELIVVAVFALTILFWTLHLPGRGLLGFAGALLLPGAIPSRLFADSLAERVSVMIALSIALTILSGLTLTLGGIHSGPAALIALGFILIDGVMIVRAIERPRPASELYMSRTRRPR